MLGVDEFFKELEECLLKVSKRIKDEGVDISASVMFEEEESNPMEDFGESESLMASFFELEDPLAGMAPQTPSNFHFENESTASKGEKYKFADKDLRNASQKVEQIIREELSK
jgi:hypothetical protein